MAMSLSARLSLGRLPRREIEEPARGVDVAHEVGARVLDGLVAADRPPALHARPARARRPDRACAARRPPSRPSAPARRRARAGASAPRRARRAEPIGGRDLHAVEHHLEELLAADRLERQPADARAGPSAARSRLRPAPSRTATIRWSATCASLTKSLRPVSRPGTAHAQRDVGGIAGAALLHQRERGDALAGGQRGQHALAAASALPASASSEVATTALVTKGPGRHAQPISSTSRTTSSSEPPLPPSSGATSSPGQPSSAMRRHSASAKPRASSAHSCTRSGGQWRRRNSRAVEVSICCAGEGRKSIAQPRLGRRPSAPPAGRGRAPRWWCAAPRRCRRRSCGRGSSDSCARSDPPSLAPREPSRSGPHGPSRSMPSCAIFWPVSSAITLASAVS